MTDLRPVFEGPAAAASVDALAAAGPAPRLDLDVLARMLCPPAIDGEFLPGAPWIGVRRTRPVPPTPGRGRHPGPGWRAWLRARFTHAVNDTIHGHRDGQGRVAVSLSGGLDSLAVLLAARAHQQRLPHGGRGSRLVAISVDVVDDHGRSAADVAAAQLAALAPDVPHVVVDPHQSRGLRAPWHPAGPRLDALPAINAEVNAAAATCGATVLLSGDGADEHLAVPRYATALIAAEHGARGAARYLADLRGVDTGLAGETVAAAARALPQEARVGLYWAANWPQWCAPSAPQLLAEPYRARAQTWARTTVAAARSAHVAAGRSWAEADAFDAIHPYDPIPAAGPVPEASPFLAAPMRRAAHALPLALRYDPHGATPYQRAKAAVVALLADPGLGADPAVLPAAKQHYAHAITAGDHGDVAAPRLHHAGLLRSPVVTGAASDPAIRRAVRDVETWLAGAAERGFTPDRPDRTSQGGDMSTPITPPAPPADTGVGRRGAATLEGSRREGTAVRTTTRPQPLARRQRAALRDLIDADRLPGQPALSDAALAEALAGRSPIDGSFWSALGALHVEVLPGPGGTLAGAVSWAIRPSDDTGVLLWLHAHEDPTAIATLVEHATAGHSGPWQAFDFASALTLGVEALPVAHRPVTAETLTARGFTSHDLWRYLHRPLTDLPPRPDLALTVAPARLDGSTLTTADGAGTVEVTAPVGGTAMIGWLGVDPAARGRGLGADLLAAALHHLAEHGARDVVLYVDDDEPGGARDRSAANHLYDRSGFTQVDRLHSYTRP